jgi:CRP-like cAMP-binding protein
MMQKDDSTGIDLDHLDLWSDLFSTLTTEERDAFYFSLKQREYNAYDFVFSQGERNTNLYFVGKGSLSLICQIGGRDVLVKKLGPGDLVGEDTCFSNTVCTASMFTLSDSILYILSREAMAKWSETAPALDSKLSHYCGAEDKVRDLLNRKGLDRRVHERFKLSGKGVMQILDSAGKAAGRSYDVKLSDVSVGGLSVFYQIAKREAAQLLLGRKVKFKLYHPTSKDELLNRDSTVVAVRLQPFEDFSANLDDYSIHTKFDAVLDGKTIKTIASAFKNET